MNESLEDTFRDLAFWVLHPVKAVALDRKQFMEECDSGDASWMKGLSKRRIHQGLERGSGRFQTVQRFANVKADPHRD